VARRTRAADVLLLPPTFAILHVAYGAGFLAGLVRFARDSRARGSARPADARRGELVSAEAREAVLAERERMRDAYRRREALPVARYAPWQPAEEFMRAGRRRRAIALLREAERFPRAGDACLEIGCGALGWLADLLSWGLRARDLHGIDLDVGRIARAREALPPADLRVGDATSLPWQSGTFRLVIASTVFSSVLDPGVREAIAGEITRVLAPGGAFLFYDLALDNPSNPDVRGVTRRSCLRSSRASRAAPSSRHARSAAGARRRAARSRAGRALESLPFLAHAPPWPCS
jgi:ubiquinone/menaquinone biosynthesis C-methylase UbiE